MKRTTHGSSMPKCIYFKLLLANVVLMAINHFYFSELLQREQQEMSAQLASLQSDVRVSYGNDALMPDSTAPLDLLPSEDSEHLGFIHPESFNQPNTDNHGTHKHTHTRFRDDTAAIVLYTSKL